MLLDSYPKCVKTWEGAQGKDKAREEERERERRLWTTVLAVSCSWGGQTRKEAL